MIINIRGDKLLVTDGIKEYINSKMNKIDKYFDATSKVKATIVVRINGRNQIIEVTIPTRHFTLRAEESNKDLYAAIDLVIDKLERQIRKNKTRIEKKIMKEKKKDINFDYLLEIADDNKQNEIVKRKKVEMKPMDEEEAILQMNLLGHDFFIFKDTSDNNCVLYRRKDGNYGIIEIEK